MTIGSPSKIYYCRCSI